LGNNWGFHVTNNYIFFYSCPPVDVIKDLLSTVERVTFYGFLIGLAKHAGVNDSIGKWKKCHMKTLETNLPLFVLHQFEAGNKNMWHF